jgi:ABC-type transport system involved in multi-copper enzyme maturation permease subunit
MSTSSVGASHRTLNQTLALAVGALFLLIGIAGFFVTGFTDHDPSRTLAGFAVNPLHNIVHLLIGGAGIALARTQSGARTYGLLLIAGYGLTFLYGLFAQRAEWDFLNINAADNVLHLLAVLAGAVIAFYGKGRNATR